MHPIRAGHHEVDLPVRPTTLVRNEVLKVCPATRGTEQAPYGDRQPALSRGQSVCDWRSGSHGDFALDAGDCIPADPDILARAIDVNSARASKDGTLAGDVVIRRNA
jgi:hypothetical protein